MRRIKMIGWALFGAGLLSACAGERLHRDGLALVAEGKPEQGVEKLAQAVGQEPGNVVFKSDWLSRRAEQVDQLLLAAADARSHGQWEVADTLVQRVLHIEPQNGRARQMRDAIARERRAAGLLEQGVQALNSGDADAATRRYRDVLANNPDHAGARALRDSVLDQVDKRNSDALAFARPAKPINLELRDAGLKIALDALTRATGINFILDRDVRPDARTTILLHQASVDEAIEAVLQSNRLEKKVLNRNTVLIYANTPEKVKEYQELVVKGFYLANADVKRTEVMLRGLLKAKDIYVDEKLNLLIMRDTPDAIRLAEKMIAMQDLDEPEVMLQVEVLEVKRSRLNAIGVQWPNTLTLTPIAAKPLATLDDLKGLNASRLATSLPSATLNLRRDIGDARILANPSIRARNREKAKVMIGDKVPVVSVTTTATGVSSESVQYLDVGIKLDVESNVYLHDEVGIKIGMEVSSLVREVRTPGGTLAYQIGSRAASTVLRLKDGETQILAGLISDEERSSANRVPGLGDVPLLGRLFSTQQDNHEKTEIVLSITPHLVRNINRPDAADSEFSSGTELSLRDRAQSVQLATEDKAGARAADAAPVADKPTAAPTVLQLDWSGPRQVRSGATFKLALRLKADGGVRSLPFQLGFDPAQFQVLEVLEGPFFKQHDGSASLSSNIDQEGGKVFVSVVRAGGDGAQGEADVAVLTVRALAPKAKAEMRLLSSAPLVVGDQARTALAPAPFHIDIVD